MLTLEGSPRAVAQRRRTDHQHVLSPLGRRLFDELAREVRLAETHLVCDQHSVEFVQELPGAPQAVLLERGELYGRTQRDDFVFGSQLAPVTLPEHPQVDDLWGMRLEP